MFLSICKFIIFSLFYFLWFFAAQGKEVTIPQSTLNNEDYCVSEGSGQCKKQLLSDPLDQIYTDLVLNYFLDIVFENTFCSCVGSDGCTRGCRLSSYLNKSQSPPIMKCNDQKPTGTPSDNCARHVRGAIMAVIHDFLLGHCEIMHGGTLGHVADYKKCVKNFITDANIGNVNICRNGFMFPSAFCMLNLDGKGAKVYNSIRDREVRSTCKRWDRYNQLLLVFNTSYGGVARIPFFKRISSKRNKEFQKDPRKIPTGAIVVTRLYRKNGHVEVKTNRNTCGEDKNQTCFCSDFCDERPRYDYPVLAVFEWSPEFIRYVSLFK